MNLYYCKSPNVFNIIVLLVFVGGGIIFSIASHFICSNKPKQQKVQLQQILHAPRWANLQTEKTV